MILSFWLLPGVLALAAYAVAALLPQRGETAVRVALISGWLAHAAAIAIDTSGAGAAGSGARFGFAPALSVTLWLVIAVYLIESRSLPLVGVRRSLAVLGAVAVVLALAFPGELRPQALSRWAPLHWVMGIASYGLFGAAVLHAAMLSRADRQMRQLPQRPAEGGAMGLPLLRLERLTFRFVAAGFAVLTAAGTGTTRRCSPCWGGACSPRCSPAAASSAGAARLPPAGSMPARGCCCWRMWDPASSSKSCCTVRRPSDR
jgi:ABC-type uncharacterized transport system permease subunit